MEHLSECLRKRLIRPGHPGTKKTNKTNKTNSEEVLRPYLGGHNTSSGLVLLVLLFFLVPGAPDNPVPASLCRPRTLFRASPARAARPHVFRTLSADPGSAKPSSAVPINARRMLTQRPAWLPQKPKKPIKPIKPILRRS